MTARKLEGRVFFVDSNNGVTAIASAEVEENFRLRTRIRCWFENNLRDSHQAAVLEVVSASLEHISITPIFTFASEERAQAEPWFTGGRALMTALYNYIVVEGGQIRKGLYVPFSNGAEKGHHGLDAMRSELDYVTTCAQFVDFFGATPAEVLARDGQTTDA